MEIDSPPSPGDLLDQEITSLTSRIAALSNTLQVQTTSLLQTSPLAADALVLDQSPRARPHPLRERLRARRDRQAAFDLQSTYRFAGGGVTSFRIHDPDPNAVDGGRVLGLRFEIMSRGRFLRPYFVFLNRPRGGGEHGRGQADGQAGGQVGGQVGGPDMLRVHRHTVPACIPLGGIAARYLPVASRQRQQDLVGFARALRHSLVTYHNRIGVVADARRVLRERQRHQRPRGSGGGGEDDGDDDDNEHATAAAQADRIVDLAAADPEARQVRIEWADGRSGRVLIDEGGSVGQVVAFGGPAGGRDWAIGGGAGRAGSEEREVEGLLRRMGINPDGMEP